MIVFKNLTKSYNKNEKVIKNLNLKIEKGEFVFLTGETGSGKSTILKLIYKGEDYESGSLNVFGKEVKKTKTNHLRRKIGVVFQDFELLKNKTVYENVSYPLLCLGVSPFEAKKRTNKMLKKMRLIEFKNKKPNELSGGQQQKVVIARAIINNPDILICDEPTGNLDPKTAMTIMEYLIDLNEQGKTIIMSTHNEEIVREFKKRVIKVEKGEVILDQVEKDRSHNNELDFLTKLGLGEDFTKEAERYIERR